MVSCCYCISNFNGALNRRWHYVLAIQSRTIEVVNPAENDQEDLIADLVAIVYSFTARLYGQRRAKRKTERIVQELQAEERGEA